MNKKLALLAVVSALNFAPAAFGQYFFIVEKQIRFNQTGPTDILIDPDAGYRFQVQIGSNGDTPQDANTPTPPNQFLAPGNETPISLIPPAGTGEQWRYRQDYAIQAPMDAAFPSGNYTVTIAGNTGNISLTGDGYPNIPKAAFSIAGNWSGNVYTIYQGQDLVINTNSIFGFTPGAFRVGIDAAPVAGFVSQNDIQFDSFDGGLTADSGNITIPGSLLQSGQTWDVSLEFNAFSSISNSTFPGNFSVGLYTVQTNFQVSAIPEPAETALMISSLALGLALWRRRKAA